MHKSFLRLLSSLLFTILVILLLNSNSVSAYSTDVGTLDVILYVKPGANGTCSSWGDACELQTALYNAVAGDQIWVAAGTYKPTSSLNREATFQLKSGVAIYGGFPAAGGEWFQRNWETNLTTLSGDIGVIGNIGDNSYHVVTGSGVDATALLDGFNVSGGNANGNDLENNKGGGMYNWGGSPTLTNVNFIGSNADTGGGMFNSSSSPSLTDVTFSSNSANNYGGGMYNSGSSPSLINVTFSSNGAFHGGGMVNEGDSNSSLTHVTFSSNTATYYSGGMYNVGSSPTLNDVIFSDNSANYGGGMCNESSSPTLNSATFSDNTAASSGGGVFNMTSSNPTLINVTFNSNSATYNGGGMDNESSSPSLSNVTFSGNSATYYGGGMYNYHNSSPSLSNVTFSSNSAFDRGGGMYNYNNSSPSLTNVTFSGNSANTGGGMANENNSSPSLANVTFSGNSATYTGGGMCNYFSSPSLSNVTFSDNLATSYGGGMFSSGASPSLSNSILWGNTPDQISGSASVTYSDIQGGWAGTGNINQDPFLGPLADNGGLTLTHSLVEGSPAIDSGDPTNCPAIDQRAYARPIDGDGDGTAICDMGAYEYASYPATFSLTIDIVGSGSIAKNPDKSEYLWGEVVTLTPIPDPDWVFIGWGGDASGMDNPLTITIYEDTNITANFRFDAWTINLSVYPQGSGEVVKYPDQPTYHYGDQVTLTALPNPGWSFAGWTGDASGTSSQIIVTMNDNLEITANFAQIEYTLSVSINPPGMGTVTKSPNKPYYNYGDVVTLTASGITGWRFTGWSGNATGVTNPLQVTITGNTNITANFSNQYTLSTIVDPSVSGTITRDINQDTYTYGTQVVLTANPNPGWTFAGWGGDASGSDNPLTITIIEDTSITATFTQDDYTLSVTPIGSGTVAVDPVQPTYNYGDVVTLTPTADPGWTFFEWGGDASGSDNPLTYTIIGDTNIIATFTQNEYMLTVTPIGSGSVAIDPVQDTYHYGDVISLTPTAEAGWTFAGWGDDASGSDNPLTYTIVGDTSITATFTQDEYTLTVTPVGSGSVVVDPDQTTYHYGDIITLTPSADPGWTFAGWGGDASGSDNPLTYTISGDTSITATFTQDEYSLTVTPIGSGMVTIDPVQATYQYGDVVTLTPAADPGWTFAGWGGDASGSDNPLTVTITGNTSIIVTFTQIEYTLAVDIIPVESGTVIISPMQTTYHYGDEVSLTPAANPGWTFSEWGGDATGSDNPLTVTIFGDTNITANFTQDLYTLDVTIEGSGSVAIDPVQATYTYRTEVTLTATADPSWSFAGWGGDPSGSDNPLTFTIQGNTSITALFTTNWIFLPMITR